MKKIVSDDVLIKTLEEYGIEDVTLSWEKNKVLSKNLKSLQGKEWLTTHEIARYCEVSQSSAFNWLKGKTRPSLKSLKALSRIFNVSVETLLK